MQCSFSLSVLLACFAFTPPSLGQTALERLEEELRRRESQPPATGQLPPVAEVQANRGYLGIVPDKTFPVGGGARLLQVVAGSPADLAGLRPGDVIKQFAGQPIRSYVDLGEMLQITKAGDSLPVVVTRAGRTAEIPVKLGVVQAAVPEAAPRENITPRPRDPNPRVPANLPEEMPLPAEPRLGVRTVKLTEEARKLLGVPVDRGAWVAEVDAGSPADLAGVPLDAVIVAVNGLPVASPDQFLAALEKAMTASEAKLTYYVGEKLINREVQFPGNRVDGGDRVRLLEDRIDALERQLDEFERQLDRLHAAQSL